MKKISIFLILFIKVAGFSAVLAAESYSFKHYSTDQGLSQSAVNDVVQDQHGMFWMATQNGLNRFDGYRFKIFDSNNSAGLASNYIFDIYVDEQQYIWLGTTKGAYRFNPYTESFFALPSQDNENPEQVNQISMHPQGWLIAATDQGVRVWNEKLELHRLIGMTSNLSVKPSEILFEFEGVFFVAGRTLGIEPLLLQDRIPEHLEPLSRKAITGVKANGDELWIGTSEGVYLYKNEQLIPVAKIQSVISFVTDYSGNTWMGSQHGLYLFSPLTSQVTKIPVSSIAIDSLRDSFIHQLLIDAHGLLWVGTQNTGVAVVNTKEQWAENLSAAKFPDKIPTTSIVTVFEDSAEQLWVGTSAGVSRLSSDRSDVEIFTTENQAAFNDNWISNIIEDENGVMWLGFYRGALAYLKPNSTEFVSFSLNDMVVQTTDFFIHGKELIVTTRNHGYFIVNIETMDYRHFEADLDNSKGLITNRLQMVFEDSQGEIWLGTFDSGLLKVIKHGEEYEQYAHDAEDSTSLSDQLVLAVAQFDDNYLWVGTLSGLNKLDLSTGKSRHFDIGSGFPDNTMYSALPFDESKLMIATNSGLVSFDTQTEEVLLYTKGDGLINDEYNSNAFYIADDGRMMLGGINGLSVIMPSLAPTHDSSPTVKIVEFLLFNNPISGKKSLKILDKPIIQAERFTLEYDQDMFGFQFSTMRPNLNDKLNFRYQLVGFNRDWIETEANENSATYTNIPAGNYVFNVQARLPGSEWGAIKSVELSIASAWWLTSWAIFGYVFMAVVIPSLFVWQWLAKNNIEKKSYHAIRTGQERLSMALWATGNELWELNLAENKLHHHIGTGEFRLDTSLDWNNGECLKSYVHPEDVDIILSKLKLHLKGEKESYEATYRIRNEEGEWHWVMDKGRVVKRDNFQAIKVSGSIQNIDTLKRTQMQLKELNEQLEQRVKQRTEQLNKSNKELTSAVSDLQNAQNQLVESEKMASLGAMVAGIAHEVNTPLGICLTAITHLDNTSQTIFKKYQDKQMRSEDFERFIDELKTVNSLAISNIYRATELIGSFKQVAVGQSSESLLDFSLYEVIRDSVRTTEPKLKKTHIDMHLDCDESLRMTSYPGAISQIIINFIMNSITHGFPNADHGDIWITVTRDENDEYLILYKDNGEGIEHDKLHKVFDPFFTTNRAGGNTGLGMHITYNLVTQKLGGMIVANSWVGQGVEFYIRLPVILEDKEIEVNNAEIE